MAVGRERVVCECGDPGPGRARHGRRPVPADRIATASPELYLRRRGHTVESGPIKGTGRTAADLLPKDHAENVADLVADRGQQAAVGVDD
ncbi:hypothetical protein ACFWHW_33865, partial [Streptomyces pharetrae]